MLPRKRPVQGVDVEEDNNNSGSSLKKNRIGCLIAETDGSNNSTCAVAGDSSNSSGGSSSVVVEPSLSNMALGDSSQYIDEDLHSRLLVVYGRETMRRLFASNVLVSGMQGLGAEVGNLPDKIARCHKDRRRKARKSEPCHYFYSRGSSSDY